MDFKTTTFGLALAGLACAPNLAQAEDCFILVHGHNPDGTSGTEAIDYWSQSSIPGRTAGDFIEELIQESGSHYEVVGWNADNDAGYPYWHPAAAGSVAWQILAITNGQGDGFDHDNGCSPSDDFYVVAHSQGGQVLSYINANSYAGAPYQDKAINTMDEDQLGSAPLIDFPFTEAMASVNAVFTIGGAINGTEGMDDVCDGGLDGAFVNLFKNCIPSMQTYSSVNPSSYSGSTMGAPVYAIGGYDEFPFPFNATSLVLDGQDDGIVNLASQMNCTGAPDRDLEKDFTERGWFNRITFRCNGSGKRHGNSYNLASIDEDHDAQKNAAHAFPTHVRRAQGVPGCGRNRNSAGTIAECVAGGL